MLLTQTHVLIHVHVGTLNVLVALRGITIACLLSRGGTTGLRWGMGEWVHLLSSDETLE